MNKELDRRIDAFIYAPLSPKPTNNSNNRVIPSPHEKNCLCSHCFEEAFAKQKALEYIQDIDKYLPTNQLFFADKRTKKVGHTQTTQCHRYKNENGFGCAAISSNHQVYLIA